MCIRDRNTPFNGVWRSSVALSDFNNDGFSDVFITGRNDDFDRIAELCINNGDVTSIDELGLVFNLDFILYPNPTNSNDFNIRLDSEENDEVNIKVFDINGTLLRQQNEFAVIGQQTIPINIASLSAGSYFLQIINGKRMGTAKFFVQ